MVGKISDLIFFDVLSFSYKLVAQSSDSSTKESSFYTNAIFYGQSSDMKTKNNDDEDFQFKMQNQTNQKKTLQEYKCNERYPCYKELWHLTELVSNILLLPTWVWKHTMDNNILYYWLTTLMHLPNRYEQPCYAFKKTT